VVIAIIAVLAAVIAPNVFQATEKSKIANCISTLRAIRAAAFAFYADIGNLPCSKAGGWGKDPGFVQQITAATCWPVEGGCNPGCIDIPRWDGPYLEKWPEISPWRKGGGGKYNWNRWDGFFGCTRLGTVTLEIYGAIPQQSLQRIDQILDDGDLTKGGIYVYSAPPYEFLNYNAACYD
jgi:general secretion pathway protein G